MATAKEKEEMRKALAQIDNKFEMIAYIFTYRQKELKNIIILLLLAFNIGLLIKFTPIIEILLSLVKRLLGV